jgi:hypothetical protein
MDSARLASTGKRDRLGAALVAMGISLAIIGAPREAMADQGGISFWLPGVFGSLAATPLQPGWSLATLYYHASTSAGGDVAASRAIHLPNRTANLTVNLNAALETKADIVVLAPTYAFATPVLGGQFAMTVAAAYARAEANIDANLVGALGPIGFATERSVGDARWGFSDVFFQPTLRWNQGVDNYMVYGLVNLPVGTYDPDRLVNFGFGHVGVDIGGGYTYLNPQTGWEWSAVGGFTYNFKNPSLDYQNGINGHLDLGLSKFLSKQVLIGVVGYAYQQLTADSGAGATLGDFKSRVFGLGPQIGFIFPVGDLQGYLNVKGYREFGAEHRAEGWNVWVALVLSPEPKPPEPAKPRLVMK